MSCDMVKQSGMTISSRDEIPMKAREGAKFEADERSSSCKIALSIRKPVRPGQVHPLSLISYFATGYLVMSKQLRGKKISQSLKVFAMRCRRRDHQDCPRKPHNQPLAADTSPWVVPIAYPYYMP